MSTVTQSPTNKQRRVRFSFQRQAMAFMAWLNERNTDLVIKPVIVKKTEKLIEFEFPGYPQFLFGRLSNERLDVYVNDPRCKSWRGRGAKLINSLLELELPAIKELGHYACAHCEQGDRDHFDAPEELWRAHLYSSLEFFINEQLHESAGLKFTLDEDLNWVDLAYKKIYRRKKLPLQNDDVWQMWDWKLGSLFNEDL